MKLVLLIRLQIRAADPAGTPMLFAVCHRYPAAECSYFRVAGSSANSSMRPCSESSRIRLAPRRAKTTATTTVSHATGPDGSPRPKDEIYRWIDGSKRALGWLAGLKAGRRRNA
jgi:hypothetical protein